MADRFLGATRLEETHLDHCYDHLIAVAEKGYGPGKLWGPRGVAIDSNTNQIYLAEGWLKSSRVSIFSETGEFQNTFSHEHMKSPCGIAIHRDNVYVSDKGEHFIFHFKVATGIHLVARLGGKGSEIGRQFNEPRQLAISTSGDIFVTDCYNNQIQILDSDLHYQRNISHHSMTQPCDIKLTPNEVYVLSQSNSPCFHVFSYAGQKIRSLITRGFGMQVSDPFFFCLGANEDIIISDWGSDQIQIFTKEGTLLRTLGEPGHEVGMFSSPCGIVLTNSLQLVVVSLNNNYGLQIFSCLQVC